MELFWSRSSPVKVSVPVVSRVDSDALAFVYTDGISDGFEAFADSAEWGSAIFENGSEDGSEDAAVTDTLGGSCDTAMVLLYWRYFDYWRLFSWPIQSRRYSRRRYFVGCPQAQFLGLTSLRLFQQPFSLALSQNFNSQFKIQISLGNVDPLLLSESSFPLQVDQKKIEKGYRNPNVARTKNGKARFHWILSIFFEVKKYGWRASKAFRTLGYGASWASRSRE